MEIIIAAVAQLVEQLICNQPVVGSSPISGSVYSPVAQLVEQVAVNHRVVGSSPAGGAFLKGQ